MACGSTFGFSDSIWSSGTPVLLAMLPSVSPTCTVYVERDVAFFLAFTTAAFFFAVDVVVTVGVVAPSLVLEPRLPEPLTTARKATTTTINAKGARKRAGLLLVR